MKVKFIAMMLLLLSLATNVMGQEGKYNLGRGYRAFVEIEEIGIQSIRGLYRHGAHNDCLCAPSVILLVCFFCFIGQRIHAHLLHHG